MCPSVIDKFYEDFKELMKYLEENKQFSFRSDVDNNFKKILLVAAGSFLEEMVKDILRIFVESKSNNNILLISFCKNKAIERQFHTYFDWDKNNVNQFFGLFGEDFKRTCMNDVENNESLEKAIKSFIEIGRERNKLVHNNFAGCTTDKKTDDIYQLYKDSLMFIEYISKKLF